MKTYIQILFILILFPFTALAQGAIQTNAKQAIVLDYDTGTVLFEKNSNERMPTSSMSKVMTAYVIFEALKNGEISLDDKFTVSEKAWRKDGSKMFVEVNKQVTVEDLIRGVVVQSGNDATIVLAEGLRGSEGAFADALNVKAQELGMENSHFMNASGWPDPDHYSTAKDLAVLAKAVISDFPEYYKYYNEKEFTYNSITQQNRNPLLYRNIGADGVKTGHTEAGGYGLIGSGVQNGRRVIVVVNGLADEKERAQESADLLEWGLQRFTNKELFGANDVVETAAVAMGKTASVSAVTQEPIIVTLPKVSKDVTVTAKFMEPLRAPITKGQEIGVLEIETPYGDPIKEPLYSGEDVESLGFFSSALAKAKYLIAGG